MQVSLLKLNAGIGASVERAATLERQNSQLREVVAQLGSTDRIQAEAQRRGLVVPPAGAVTFLGKDGKRIGGDAASALAAATAADATAGAETSVPPATQPTPATPEDGGAAAARAGDAAAHDRGRAGDRAARARDAAARPAHAGPGREHPRGHDRGRRRAAGRRPRGHGAAAVTEDPTAPAQIIPSTPLGPAATCP